MATWPSGSKASTQYTDQPTDRIADARAEINQTIANQGEIIDMFNIASPNDGDVLVYNNSNSRFEVGDAPGRCLLQYNSAVPHNNSSYTLYNGGFTIQGNANAGVSIVDSSTIAITAGDYLIRALSPRYSGTYGSNRFDIINAKMIKDDSSGSDVVSFFATKQTSFYFRVWGTETNYESFASDDQYQFYWSTDTYANADVTNIAFLIEKIG